MITLAGYSIKEQLYQGKKHIICKAERTSDHLSVVLKFLHADYPEAGDLARLKHEYKISQQLNLPGIVQIYSIEDYNNTPVLVMEDFGGVSLKHIIHTHKLSVETCMQIALSAAQTLQKIHHHAIIHKDINPNNIIVNLTTHEVKIIDFGLSTLLCQENKNQQSPRIEGTLYYISPEQTGRTTYTLDYRSDFYSLGVTLYETLIGFLPFQGEDEMEWIHCHLAQNPTPLHILNPKIPQILSEIILRLMEKMPEARYQSASGLVYDLENCLQQLSSTGTISSFPLCQKDISSIFLIPQKLYGRGEEVAGLLSAFAQVSTGAKEIALIAGHSGIGKSALVREIHRPIIEKQGYFIASKFEQFKRDIPYYPLIQAFKDLIGQILSESEQQIQVWRKKLQRALGTTGQVMVDVIPELEHILGPQPPLPQLPSTEAQNRFQLVFGSFIKTFATAKHPLTLFLDDLQWADASSLKMVELFTADIDIKYIFFIGAYRQNEVDDAHPLMLSMDKIGRTLNTIHTFSLRPLTLSHIQQMLSETLRHEPASVISLGELVLQKTGGNPFFLNQFLMALHEEGHIWFDTHQGTWTWDIDGIRHCRITDNVVDLMIEKIQRLPEPTQVALQLAACIGSEFDLYTLSIIIGQTSQDTSQSLWPALQLDLIIPASEEYKYVQHIDSRHIRYTFLHDRVQQAAYALVKDPIKKEVHLKIGKLLLETIEDPAQDDRIFEIVNQINYGIDLITYKKERYEMAQLNLIAGRKAKASAASEAALHYLSIGISFLDLSSWQDAYDLTLGLYIEATEAAYISTKFNEMDRLSKIVILHGRTLLDQIRVYEIMIVSYKVQNKMMESIQLGQHVLKLLGVSLPKNATKMHVLLKLIKIKMILKYKKPADFLSLPIMTNPEKLATMDILGSITTSAYLACPNLLPLVLFEMMLLSLRYGNAPLSAYAYSGYALILCSILGDMQEGYAFGNMSLTLLDSFTAVDVKAKTIFSVNDFIKPWKVHVKDTLDDLIEGHRIGLSAGDWEFSCYCAHIYCYHSFCIGKNLVDLEKEISTYAALMIQLKQVNIASLQQIWWQTTLHLLGRTDTPHVLSGQIYNEEGMLPIHLDAKDYPSICTVYIHKLFLSYTFGHYEEALDHARNAYIYKEGVKSLQSVVLLYFYDSLTRLALYDADHPSKLSSLYIHVMHNQKKLRKWADHAPMNFLHKYYLVEAEQARVLGNGKKAVAFYFKAIEWADQNGYLQEQALAYELAGKFYLSKSNFDMGEECIRNAYHHYVKWGALGKAKQLKARYVKLLTVDFEQSTHSAAIHTTSTSTSDMLDTAAIIKATQAISGEIVLEQLLRKLVKIVLEYAGAQRVYFIVKKDQDLVVEAEGILEGENITVLQSIPIRKSFKIPISIINYVYRTKEDVVLSVASISEKFMMDPYIAKEKPKSILCTAVMNKRKLIGILYLENNLLSSAFTENRIKILSIICSQLAIALENANLYNSLALHKNNLENLVEERTRKLSETNKALQETTANIRSLLNHAGQGFLSIRADLLIQPDYSTECLRIFHTHIEGMYFPHLIYPTDCEDRKTMEQILHTIFQKNASKQKLIYLSLLPEEITLYEQHIEIEYKLIENQWSENPFMTLMVILTDVTEKRLLEKQALEEQSTLRMVVKVVANFADFMDCVKGYEEFYTERLQEILQSPLPPLQQLFEIYRSIHTFKGSFSQYELSSIVSKLHQLESALSAFKDTALVDPLTLAEIPDFTALLSPQDMKQWLSEELDILQNILGKQYFTKDHSIHIDQDKLLEIEAKMQSILSSAEYVQLLPLIRQLRYRPLAELLKGYPAYVQNLSERLEKYVHPFIIQGEELLVDPELYLPFAKSLIHIFRNCMDHGIESPEQRMDMGKDEYGTIQCKIHKDHDHILLTIEDDGHGIDTAKIRDKAVQKGILRIQEAETLSEAQVVELIFMDELSTKDAVTQVSGRGIGMSSVKKEVDALKGSIQVTSSLHMGTKFVITLPK